MRSPIPDYLAEAVEGVASDTSGAPAGYIPELAAADPDRLAAVFATVDGEIYGAGDTDVEFTIQSISKPFTYALALADRGVEAFWPGSVSNPPVRRSTRSLSRTVPVVRSTP